MCKPGVFTPIPNADVQTMTWTSPVLQFSIALALSFGDIFWPWYEHDVMPSCRRAIATGAMSWTKSRYTIDFFLPMCGCNWLAILSYFSFAFPKWEWNRSQVDIITWEMHIQYSTYLDSACEQHSRCSSCLLRQNYKPGCVASPPPAVWPEVLLWQLMPSEEREESESSTWEHAEKIFWSGNKRKPHT